MSHNIPPPSSYRTPFDFSVGGAITQNTTQIAQLRDRYGREARALDTQAKMAQQIQQTERDRYLQSLQALRDRAVAADQRQAKAEHHRAEQRRWEQKRTQQINQPLAQPNLLPFSAHFQRFPPPLNPQLKHTIAHRSGKHTARALKRTTQTLASTWQPTRGGATTQRAPRSTHTSQPDPNGYFEYVDADDWSPSQTHAATASSSTWQSSAPFPQPVPPSMPSPSHASERATGPLGSIPRQGYGIRHSSLKEEDPPLQSFNVVPPDTGIPLPFKNQELLALGHKNVQHPFYAEDVRLINKDDQDYMTLLNQRYPNHLQPPPPSIRAEQRLPSEYNLNGWSVQFGTGIKKCRETRTMEFLLAKRYI